MVTTAITSAISNELVNSLGELITKEYFDQKQYDKNIALALINKIVAGQTATYWIKQKFASEFTMKALKAEFVAHTSKARLKSLMEDLSIMQEQQSF